MANQVNGGQANCRISQLDPQTPNVGTGNPGSATLLRGMSKEAWQKPGSIHFGVSP